MENGRLIDGASFVIYTAVPASMSACGCVRGGAVERFSAFGTPARGHACVGGFQGLVHDARGIKDGFQMSRRSPFTGDLKLVVVS